MTRRKQLAEQRIGGKTTPQISPDTDGFTEPIGWNFSLMDTTSGLPWMCTFAKLTRFRQQLLSLEGKSFKDIERENTSNHNWDSYDKLDARARDYLTSHQIDPEALWQIRLQARVRLFGVRARNIFKLLWLDKEHQVYKTEKKHT